MSKFHCLNAGIKTVWCKKQRDMESQVYMYEDDDGEVFYDVGVRIGDTYYGFDYLRMDAKVFNAILNSNVKFHISQVSGPDLCTVELDDIGVTVLNEV